MDLPVKEPLKVGAQGKFRDLEFRKMMKDKGLSLTWEQAAECPCVRRLATAVHLGGIVDRTGGKATSTEPRADCPVCKGRGYFHHSPQTVKAIVTSAESNPKRFELWGESAVGMIALTLLPENLPGYLDRFTMHGSVLVFRETRTRTAETVEALRYPIVTRTLDLETGTVEVNVLYAHRASPEGEAALDGVLTPGEDFEVVDGKVDWTLGDDAGTAPEEGGRYSFTYYAHPAFIVLTHPHAFRDTVTQVKKPAPVHTALPVNAIAKLEFFGATT